MDPPTQARARERATAPSTLLILGTSGDKPRNVLRVAVSRHESPNSQPRTTWLQRDRRTLLVFLIRLNNHFSQLVLAHRVEYGAEKREAPALAVDGVCARWKCDVPPITRAPFPHGETNQLESGQRTVSEMKLGVSKLAGRIPLVVRRDLDRHGVLLPGLLIGAVARVVIALALISIRFPASGCHAREDIKEDAAASWQAGGALNSCPREGLRSRKAESEPLGLRSRQEWQPALRSSTDDEDLSQRQFIGMSDGKERCPATNRRESSAGAAVQLELRRPASPDNFHIAPDHALGIACSERFHGSLFSGKPPGEVNGGHSPPRAVRNLVFSENAVQKALAVAFDCVRDAVDIGGVEPKPDDIWHDHANETTTWRRLRVD